MTAITLTSNVPAWQDDALCRKHDPSLFDSSPGEPETDSIKLAKDICDVCPVQGLCRSWAAEQRIEYGTLGGETAAERGWYADPVRPSHKSDWPSHGTVARFRGARPKSDRTRPSCAEERASQGLNGACAACSDAMRIERKRGTGNVDGDQGQAQQ